MTSRDRAIVKLTVALTSGREATEAEVRRFAEAVDAITEHVVETLCAELSRDKESEAGRG